jgi:hypothetical protein
METLTLQRSTIRGVVLGTGVFCTLRGSPPGLRLAAGDYLLRPPQNSPVYGLVMLIEPLTPATEAAINNNLRAPSAVKFTNPAAVKFTDPFASKQDNPLAVKFTSPFAGKQEAPMTVKFRPAAPTIKFDTAAAPAVKFDTAASPASKMDTAAAPAVKFDTAASPASKMDTAAAPAIKFDSAAAPAVKFDTAAGQVTQLVVISERGIAGNSFQATAGFGDLVDVVQRAGAVKLVVV